MTISSPIKWAGGKAKIREDFSYLLNISEYTGRYVDLFCGSLSLPLTFLPKRAWFNDINSALINLYRTIQEKPRELLDELRELNKKERNNRETFNQIRTEFNRLKKTNLDRPNVRLAGLFLYLNKRSFNGIYRENRSGEYNVPYREYKTSIYDEVNIIALSEYFSENDILFTSLPIEEIKASSFTCRDLVYLDPPYYPSEKSQFTGYSSSPFGVKEQEKLRAFCGELDENGIKFIQSNSPCPEIRKLYSEFFMYDFYIGRQMRNAQGKSKVFERKHESNEILIWNFFRIAID